MADQASDSSAPKSSAGAYQSQWSAQHYYNPEEDGICPVFPDPDDKRVAIRYEKLRPHHIPGCILVEKEFLSLNDSYDVGTVEMWTEEIFHERLLSGKAERDNDDTTVGFVAVAPSLDQKTEEKEEKEGEKEKEGDKEEEEKKEGLVEGEKIVGFIFLDTLNDNIIWFKKLFVFESYRRLGIGYSLAVKGVQSLEKRSMWPTAVRLFVATENQAAIKLYEKFGMKIVNEITSYYAKGKNAYTMQFIVKKKDFENRTIIKPQMRDVLTMGLYRSVGIEVKNLDGESSSPFGDGGLALTDEQEEALQKRFGELLEQHKNDKRVWVADLPGADNLLSPDDVVELQLAGVQVGVEMSKRQGRKYTDTDYAIAGATLRPSGSWIHCPPATCVLVPDDIVTELAEKHTKLFITDISCLKESENK